MKTWALVSGIVALVSVCFVDDGIVPVVAKGGRVVLAVSTAIFVVTEAIVLLI
jgi:hypothetical protein